MNSSLPKWISDSDAQAYLDAFRVGQLSIDTGHISARVEDYYLSLVGDLFSRMQDERDSLTTWSRLGNALAQFAARYSEAQHAAMGINRVETLLYAAAAFYCGGFSASAYVTLKGVRAADLDENYLTCFELLARPRQMTSSVVQQLLLGVENGDPDVIAQLRMEASRIARTELMNGPGAWIPARLTEKLLERFQTSSLRSVLPDGYSDFWSPLVRSLLKRPRPTWDFFPSQIEAIEKGLLTAESTFSIQMPTGAGKTTLCETLLYWHVRRHEAEVAVLLVPFRSLASELRGSLVRWLNEMGISARCAYGGTVPTGREVRELKDTQVLIATPEALTGLMGSDNEFFRRITLVICDEGHLLDGPSRGVGLELMLSRFRSRESGAPRFVFISAIVPNIEEINAWLGGSSDTLVKSTFRPAVAEFALLRKRGTGVTTAVDLHLHPHSRPEDQVQITEFLGRSDFTYTNTETGRQKTYSFQSVKTLAIAMARKALPMGGVAIFAANKSGDKGVIGIAEELVEQLSIALPLPAPLMYANEVAVKEINGYFRDEFGSDWIGTQAIEHGVIVHHGDIPQEAREVVERMLVRGEAGLVICTNTLAEGVNLPIRTLVLYSVKRRIHNRPPDILKARDIKNLVGRAGRPGSTTRGLVVCANEGDWEVVRRVALQEEGESVNGALRNLVEALRDALAIKPVALSNEMLESDAAYFSLIDGIDATLIDLVADEIGDDQLLQIAQRIADETFASSTGDVDSKQLLRTVFGLRATRVSAWRRAGRTAWSKETGARLRMVDTVERNLMPRRLTWETAIAPIDFEVVDVLLDWAWGQPEMIADVSSSIWSSLDANEAKARFRQLLKGWLLGERYVSMAAASSMSMNDLLNVHSKLLLYSFQSIVEQGIALLSRLVEGAGGTMSSAILDFPEYLRFGVPTAEAYSVASWGIRHRFAAVQLGGYLNAQEFGGISEVAKRDTLIHALEQSPEEWKTRLGQHVYTHTLTELKDLWYGWNG